MVYYNAVGALYLVRSCMFLTFRFVYIIAAILNITFFHFLFLFIEESKGHGRAQLMTITLSTQKYILWYAVKYCLLTFLGLFCFIDI